MILDYLPNNSKKFEKSLVRDQSEDIDFDIRSVVDPDRSPEDFIPFLAFHESVDLWYSDWPEDRKRKMIKNALKLASLKGTRAAIEAFLPYVDAELVDKVSFPRRFVIGKSAIDIDPIGHKPFTTHILVKVPISFPKHGFVFGKSGLLKKAYRTVDRMPADRAIEAVRVSKSPATFITVDLGHRKPREVGKGFPLDGSFRFGDFVDRKRI